MVVTSVGVQRDTVFDACEGPNCRIAKLAPASNVILDWREAAMLSPEFKATVKGWPVEAALSPGISLGPKDGLEHWNAERATRGLAEREPYYVEAVTEMLSEAAGISLDLAGGVRALIVGEEHFASSVEIGEPFYFSELDSPE